MKYLVLIFLLFTAVTMSSQDHAPTVEQCRNDVTIWANEDAAITSAENLTLRAIAMAECSEIDAGLWNSYHNVVFISTSQLEKRYNSFIVRHRLLKQFLKEDAHGLR